MRAHAWYIWIMESNLGPTMGEPESTNHSVLFDMIGLLARRRHQLGERCFASLGLNHTEARLLTALHEQGGTATQEKLSSLMFIDRSNAGRGLKGLEQAGFVRRRLASDDRRTRSVEITPKGAQAVKDIARLRSALASTFFGDLTEEDAGTIVALFRRALRGNETLGAEGGE